MVFSACCFNILLGLTVSKKIQLDDTPHRKHACKWLVYLIPEDLLAQAVA
jgi:hypothetical protein